MNISLESMTSTPVTVVLYNPGSSGEFLAHALTQSIPEFSQTPFHWENHNRCKFCDYFGRTLNFGPIVEEILYDRVQQYFANLIEEKDLHLGIAHCLPEYLNFLSTVGKKWPIIEITTLRPTSKKFQLLAGKNKINNEFLAQDITVPVTPNFTALDLGFQHAKHLQIEWHDLILADRQASFEKITNFLGAKGDYNKFLELVQDYQDRNRDIINLITQTCS